MSGRSTTERSQAAIDFIISYGIVLFAIALALAIVVSLGLFNIPLAPSACTPAPSFTCISYNLNQTGGFSMLLSQSTGATINVTGIACSTAANTIGYGPAYGNIGVLPYTQASQYYPSNALIAGKYIYSDGTAYLAVKCYGPSGLATGTVGTTLIGFIWLNYTYAGLKPNNIEQVAAFTLKYT